MKRFSLCSLLLGLLALSAQAQAEGFVLKGTLSGLRDGVCVALLADMEEDPTAGTLAEAYAHNGHFELRGKVEHPMLCTLITNNLNLVEKNGWPMDSIRWTYTPVFADNVEMAVEAVSYSDVPSDWSYTPAFRITGGEVQTDFTELGRMLYEAAEGNPEKASQKEEEVVWQFIRSHPRSVVSVYHANRLLQRGYRLTTEQVAQLDKAIVEVPSDTARFALFRERIAYAKKTTVGAPLVDLEMEDAEGNPVRLVEVVPQGKFVLVDFWASWCGICIASMPRIHELAEQYKGAFEVVPVSCDTNLKAWKGAMERHGMTGKQYVLTKQGYADFWNKYQVGNGVPYYTMVSPDGKVLKAPSGPEEIAEMLERYCH